MIDSEIEKLALEHETFGFGQVDARGITIHGFEPAGLRGFVDAVIHSTVFKEPLPADPKNEYAINVPGYGWVDVKAVRAIERFYGIV